jgi:DDE superfamily endonuclease
MPNLPYSIIAVLSIFLPLFSKPTYEKFLLLFNAHILSKGRRTVTELLKRVGLRKDKNFSNYHDVFNKNKWSALEGAKILFLKLISLFPDNEIVYISIDTTIERRKGPEIKSLNMQRDAVRSTKKRKVIIPGLQWLVCTIHTKLPWGEKVWALPFLTVLIPPAKPLSSSKNKNDLKGRKRKHKTLNDWICQIVKLVRRWADESLKITIVGDSAFATYLLANTCIDYKVNLTSRMRLDARTFEFPIANKKGRINLVGKRMATFNEMLSDSSLVWMKKEILWYSGKMKKMEYVTGTSLWYGYGYRPVPIRWVLIRDPKKQTDPAALFTLDLESHPEQIISEYINRWPIEVTFEEVRRHLGMETQRQWSDMAIDRETPCILASFSIITLIALELQKENNDDIAIQTSAWYQKQHVTFSDILAYVRRHILEEKYNSQFGKNTELWENELAEIINQMVAA